MVIVCDRHLKLTVDLALDLYCIFPDCLENMKCKDFVKMRKDQLQDRTFNVL